MDEKDLIKTLMELEERLIKLSVAAKQKQEALVKSNLKLLQATIAEEEKFIYEIEETEKKRISVLTDLNNKFMIKEKSMKLDDFLNGAKNKLDERMAARIIKLRNNIRGHIKSIERLNLQNKILTDTARDFIKMTVAKLIGPKRKSFLDKRV